MIFSHAQACPTVRWGSLDSNKGGMPFTRRTRFVQTGHRLCLVVSLIAGRTQNLSRLLNRSFSVLKSR